MIELLTILAFTTYTDLGVWGADVGPHEIEDFNGVPDQAIPETGGEIVMGGFTFSADGSHLVEFYRPGIRDEILLGDVHGDGDLPNYNRISFLEPVSAFSFTAFAVESGSIGASWGWASDFVSCLGATSDPCFFGVALDQPIHSFDFRASDGFDVSEIRWKPVPEPSAALLLAFGLGLMARRRV